MEVAILWIDLGIQLLKIFALNGHWVDVVYEIGRDDFSVVKMLPSDKCPFLRQFVVDTVEDILDHVEVVNMSTTNICFSQLLSILYLGKAPEVLNAHEVGPVFCIKADRDLVSFTPGHDNFMNMDTGIVHKYGPFVSSWYILLH